MDNELDQDELQQVFRAIRVLAPASTQERLQALVAAQHQIQTSGFLEAVWGLVRLQREQGIDLSQVMDTYRNLIKEKQILDEETAALHEQQAEAKQDYQKIMSELTAAKNELQTIRKEIRQEEKHLADLVGKAAGKKQQIQLDLEQCYQAARVTKADIAVASQLKAEVVKSGFSLETMLGLVQEFAPYADVKERLSIALKIFHSLCGYIAHEEKQAAEQEIALTSTLNQMASQKTQKESEIKQLKASQHYLEVNLSQLRSDLEQEQELRQFYMRFHSLTPILEKIVDWKQVVFLYCDNPFCEPFAGVNHFWTEKSATKCPHCGLGPLKYDLNLYQRLNLAVEPVKLKLGV